ncbi:MAG: MoaD/ThiS family protein [Candidatus Hadarchaeales archaeon]
MQITVKFSGELERMAGTREVKINMEENETVDTLFLKLSRRYSKVVEALLDPITGEITDKYEVLLNGRHLRDGLYTKLKNGDELTLSPRAI